MRRVNFNGLRFDVDQSNIRAALHYTLFRINRCEQLWDAAIPDRKSIIVAVNEDTAQFPRSVGNKTL